MFRVLKCQMFIQNIKHGSKWDKGTGVYKWYNCNFGTVKDISVKFSFVNDGISFNSLRGAYGFRVSGWGWCYKNGS